MDTVQCVIVIGPARLTWLILGFLVSNCSRVARHTKKWEQQITSRQFGDTFNCAVIELRRYCASNGFKNQLKSMQSFHSVISSLAFNPKNDRPLMVFIVVFGFDNEDDREATNVAASMNRYSANEIPLSYNIQRSTIFTEHTVSDVTETLISECHMYAFNARLSSMKSIAWHWHRKLPQNESENKKWSKKCAWNSLQID